MKTFKEFISENTNDAIAPFANKTIRFVDPKSLRFQSHTKKPTYVGEHAGVVQWKEAKGIGADLWEVLPTDVSFKSLKANEHLFRYTTKTTEVGDMAPLIKINIEKGLIYFLTDDAKENDKVQFETKGIKVQYLTLTNKYLPKK